MRTRATIVGLALAALMISGAGCSKCGSGHPYVPYSIGEGGAPSAEEDASITDTPPLDAGAFFANVPASVAPANTAEWTLDGIVLVAPTDSILDAAIVRDFDGDNVRDAFAIAHAAAGGGEEIVVFYKGTTDGQLAKPAIAARPPIDDAPCATPVEGPRPISTLTLVGPHAVFAQIGSPCLTATSRVLRVVSAERSSLRDRLDVEVKDPPGSAPTSFEADATDRDGDGIDDVALRVTIDTSATPFEPAPQTSAVVRWFDRPAGLSRDPQEPEASLHRTATALVTKSKSGAALAVPNAARQLRALYSAICQDAGNPRITASKWGHGISCGPSHALEEAGIAEARAYANAGYVLRAIDARDRAELAPATHTPALLTELDNAITKAAPVSSQATLRAAAAIPQIYRAKGPSWGALAFDDAGKLLVRTLAGVVRMDPQNGDEGAAADVATWPSEVLAPDGTLRFLEAYSPCDFISLHATFAPVGAAEATGDVRDVMIPVEAPLGASCASARGNPSPVTPIAWGASGLEALVAHQPILFSSDLKQASLIAKFTTQIGPHGSPRSPNGHALAVPTSLGIVVVQDDKSRLFRAPELDGGYAELRDCTVSNDAQRVACIRGGRAFAGIWAAP
jgi:hypothetical protein